VLSVSESMKHIVVLYATREGQTRRIAEHVAAELRSRGLLADVHDVSALPAGFTVASYDAAVLAASVHAGNHEKEMISFAKHHRDALERMPSAFLSISLTEAGVEDPAASAAARDAAHREVEGLTARFFEQTGWHPARVKPVAGALLYTKYNALLRFVMKHIVLGKGGSTDTSRDHEYTDFVALDRFVGDLARSLD
jgi:menaquinone-dependent protoporphyrinogen oxidase